MMRRLTGAVGGVVLVAALVVAAANEPVVVVDSAGKELKLTGVKLTAGTRRLAWLAEPKGDTDDARKGPLALEVREPHSTTYAKGVLTLVPVSAIEAVRYDYEKQTAAVSVKGLAEPVAGTIQYKGFTVLGLDGVSDGAAVKLTGGVPKTGFRSVAFPSPKSLPERKGSAERWSVQIVQPAAKDPAVIVRNLKVLYSFPNGAEQVTDALPVRKGDPLPLNRSLRRLELLAVDSNTQMAAAEVTAGSGPERLIAIPLTLEHDKRTGTLSAFLGEVDAGWKLFPLHTVKVITPAEEK